MKNTSKKHPQSRLKNPQSRLDCCNLKFVCKQMSLINNDYFEIPRLQFLDCSRLPQSRIHPFNHWVTAISQIALSVPIPTVYTSPHRRLRLCGIQKTKGLILFLTWGTRT